MRITTMMRALSHIRHPVKMRGPFPMRLRGSPQNDWVHIWMMLLSKTSSKASRCQSTPPKCTTLAVPSMWRRMQNDSLPLVC